MQTNYSSPSSFFYRNQTTVAGGFEELETYVHHNDGVDLISPSCSVFSLRSPNDMSVLPNNTIYNNAIPFNVSSEKVGCLMYEYDHEQQQNQKSCSDDVVSLDTSTQQNDNTYHNGDIQNDKTLRRLAQNRQAAKKSRLRKKAYVEQLESSRERLSQIEQELQLARQQHGGFSATASGSGAAAVAFDSEYARWLEEHQRLINDLRAAVSSDSGGDQAELRMAVEGVMGHYDRMFRLKTMGTKADVFHMLSGMWKTPAERCFMWLGGFRSSELLKILGNHLEPLTEQQLMGICNLQQSSQQAEDALSQGLEALQQSLAQSLSSTSASTDVAEYMGQMGVAMAKLGTLESLVLQADLLTHQTLRQMHRILTTRQAARALLLLNDYFSRLRALSSLWLARPTDVSPAF